MVELNHLPGMASNFTPDYTRTTSDQSSRPNTGQSSIPMSAITDRLIINSRAHTSWSLHGAAQQQVVDV